MFLLPRLVLLLDGQQLLNTRLPYGAPLPKTQGFDVDVAEEIAMEAFIKTFSGWARIRDVDRADAYLRRAVVNLCRSRIRRRSIEYRVNAVTYRREERRAARSLPSGETPR